MEGRLSVDIETVRCEIVDFPSVHLKLQAEIDELKSRRAATQSDVHALKLELKKMESEVKEQNELFEGHINDIQSNITELQSV
jgi:predicted  nucleic acid-binding Zn-ribbon protein